MRPIAISQGTLEGIGPEVLMKAMAGMPDLPPLYLIGDLNTFGALGPVQEINSSAEVAAFKDSGVLPVKPCPAAAPVVAGMPSPKNANATLTSIEMAVQDIQSGEASALCTLPLAKEIVQQAGFPHPGHTEFLGELTRGQPYMMLAASGLRVAPLTIHQPLSAVPMSLSQSKIVNAAKAVLQALKQDFGIPSPRLAIAALNPHGGENGTMGQEEKEIILPACEALKAEGLNVSGPHPADTLFHEEARAQYDAVLCMYHDQALIPLKMLDFWGGVNITLGLDIVRTSPDHGTAFEIAGKGKANPQSLINAIKMAADIAERRHG